jgi:hypothetical protein
MRGQLGGLPGFTPQKAQQGGEQTTFAVNFHFSGGRSEHIQTTIDASPAPTAIDLPAINMPALDVDLGAAPAAPEHQQSGLEPVPAAGTDPAAGVRRGRRRRLARPLFRLHSNGTMNCSMKRMRGTSVG